MLLVFVILSILSLAFSCDIYITSKCPTPPAPTEHNANWTLYCNEIKDHIDCINKKLKTCKNIQEFGPALETIKWNIKVLIEQGRSHGCSDLVDKIKLPRIPRKKKPTEASKTPATTTGLWTERAIVYIDPNCHKNLVDMYCERLENPNMAKFLYNNTLDDNWSVSMKLAASLNEVACKKLTKHHQCLHSNFRVKCEQSMALAFIKIDKFLQHCSVFKIKKQASNSSRLEPISFILLFFVIFVNFLDY